MESLTFYILETFIIDILVSGMENWEQAFNPGFEVTETSRKLCETKQGNPDLGLALSQVFINKDGRNLVPSPSYVPTIISYLCSVFTLFFFILF